MYATIEKLVFGGKGLARIHGKTIFVPFALPGEVLDVYITKEHRDYAEGNIERIINPSPYRVQPVCAYFSQCGGCNLQMADCTYQKELRLLMVKELFIRAHLYAEQDGALISGNDWEYRNRFQFHRDKKGVLGMYQYSSNNVIAIKDCPIADPALRAILKQKKLQSLFPQAARGNNVEGKNRYHVFSHKKVYSFLHPTVQIKIRHTPLEFSVFGFFQSNITMLEKLLEPTCFTLPPCQRILDFYAGIGTFSAFLIGKTEEIHLVEHNVQALQAAKNNLERIQTVRNTQCRYYFHAIADYQWIDHPASALSYDAAIIDPPRQGIHESFFSYIRTHPIPIIHYVSCNPATFVRDAKKLIMCGYRFAAWTAFDFYPQTHHSELLGIFLR